MRFRPGDYETAQRTITELNARFDAWYRTRHPEEAVIDTSDLGLLVDWKLGYGDGRLDEWTIDQLEEFLLEWCPRKVTVSGAQAARMPEGVAQAFTFLADQGLLARRSVRGDRLAAHARSLADAFVNEMTEPANFGLAKSIFGGAAFGADEPLTPERLEEMVTEFNARPFEERRALTDPAIQRYEPDLPTLGPIRLPDDDAVRASAAEAPVLAAFTSLAEYFRAPGRPLTAKGNIRLADAEALSEILGTEGLELVIGDMTFTRRSATDLPHLDHWQWWARQSGALRVRHGRLLGVEAWLRRRAKDPAAEARKACDVLMSHGALDTFVTRYHHPVYDLVDAMTSPLLGVLLTAGRPVEFSVLVDAVDHVQEATHRHSSFGDPESNRRSITRAMNVLLMLLERAGMVEQHDVTHEPTEFSQERTGGTIALTPFGVVTAVDYVRESGLDVITVGDPATMGAEDVAGLAAEQMIEPQEWSGILAAWVPHQSDPQSALRAVLDELEATDALTVAMMLPVPDDLEPDFAAVLEDISRVHGPDDVLGAVALTWLADHGRLDPERLTPETVLVSGLTTIALIAHESPESVTDALGADRPRQDVIDLIKEASRRMPPNVEALLDALAQHYPDPAVATAARKELMRLRSRLARDARRRR